MNQLVGKAQEEDEQFWKTGLYNNNCEEAQNSDESFDSNEISMSAAQDSFDSDFDRPDNDIERVNGENSEDEEKPLRRKKKILRKNRGRGVFD